MAFVLQDSLDDASGRYGGYELEPTQLSQPQSQPQASQFANSQVDPRRKYYAVLIPTNSKHAILKLPWSKPSIQVGRGGPPVANDVVLREKRVSNKHCRFVLGTPNGLKDEAAVDSFRNSDEDPPVWVVDLGSSNGTFVNGVKVTKRHLDSGDEISLGHQSALDNHEVRYIFRSVGMKGGNKAQQEKVGAVYERYEMLSDLGKGTFATVKMAVDVESGDRRAIKQITKHRFQHNPKTLKLFQREIDICQQLTHENICRLIEWYEDPQHIHLVLEFVDGGDLLDYIMNWDGDGLPEKEVQELTSQICQAMKYCHEMDVTHRDLKPENILLTKGTESQERMIKIADFGLAKMVDAGTMLKSMVGTPQYLAPEVVMQTKQKPGYESVVDSWSVGIIVYSMLTKALPFDDDEKLTLEQRIRSRHTIDFDRAPLYAHKVSDAGIDFIAKLLDKEPTTRMTMEEALRHEWLLGAPLKESPPSQALGGDSEWNIKSFDTFDSDSEVEPDDDTSSVATRNRGMTASMTNFGGDSEREANSDESFSQPMADMHLDTAPSIRAATRSRLGQEVKANENDALPTPPTTGTPTAPPSVSAGMDVDPSSPASKMDVDGSGRNATPVPKTTGGLVRRAGKAPPKRKQDDAGGSGMFSSGSLSPPPPESDEAAPPRERETTPRAGGSSRRLTRAQTARAAAEASPQTRAKSNANVVTPTKDDPSPAKRSRARKSMRLG
ncbi:hypothetical protein Q8F55_006578 [Vanrija albida]|uniref:Uncharacterized protein n=1 Tax=Vanrija albida TaxID=181172 RepID=A0ABR3PXI4_9TREE